VRGLNTYAVYYRRRTSFSHSCVGRRAAKQAASQSHDSPNLMKTISSSSMKPSSNLRKLRNQRAKGDLFLGHKVLSELRILIRLASNRANGFGPLNGYDHPTSF